MERLPSYYEAVSRPEILPIILTFYQFSHVRPIPHRGRRVGRLLSKRKDIVLIDRSTTSEAFALPQLVRAAEFFGWDSVERVAYSILLRMKGHKDIVIDDDNWDAVFHLVEEWGLEGSPDAKLVLGVGPVVEELSRRERVVDVLLGAKRKLLGWSMPRNLA